MPRRSTTCTTADLVAAMGEIAPLHLAQPWDNVGLLAGERRATLRRVLLCIDMMPAVVAEAAALGANAVVAYHPPLFKAVKTLDPSAYAGGPTAALIEAVRRGIAVYSPHTALDAADGGTGDAIARLCDAEILGPLEPAAAPGSADEVKLTTYVPADHLDRVAQALFDAGAGWIGQYKWCSFRIPGRGSFFGTEGTDPKVGRRGRLEFVDEVRLEMVCPRRVLPEVVAALRHNHPYEEPAFDLFTLTTKPASIGLGRLARLPEAVPLSQFAVALGAAVARAARAFPPLRKGGQGGFSRPRANRTHAVRVQGPKRGATTFIPQLVGDPRRPVRTLAILVGSAGDVFADLPRAREADVLVTGEIRHHDALAILGRERAAIALGHWNSERPVLPHLAAALHRRLPGVDVRVSRHDRDPILSLA